MPHATPGKPRLVFWEVTKGCNLRCRHCRATATDASSPEDLTTAEALGVIDQIADYANPILVLSGGEPLYRKDIFELAAHASGRGLRVALATNGTLVDEAVARRVRESGIRRVSISLDGSCAATHDRFRGIPGAFDQAIAGFCRLQAEGVGVQINMTIARHNAAELPAVLDMVRELGADALHTFLLVPVGCGVDLAESDMVDPGEYERILNWFYDQSLRGGIELKATCAPHYFRVMRQRQAAERRAKRLASEAAMAAEENPAPSAGIAAAEILAPGAAGIEFHKAGSPAPRAGGHPHGMNAVTKGCLAGTGVCFLSNTGEVYPCGYLPVVCGELRQQGFAEIWEGSEVFAALRDDERLEGKCGLCEFKHVCMGCRARAYAATGNYMAAEPFCVYQPGAAARGEK
jgi:radical SAM protein with 4Fe4S-binding SPASM domain